MKNWEPSQNSGRQKGDIKQFHTEGPQILGATVPNAVELATTATTFGTVAPSFVTEPGICAALGYKTGYLSDPVF